MPEISRQNNKAIVFLHHPLVAKRFIVLVPGCGEKEKFKNREIETESYDAEARQDGGDLSEDNGLVIGADHYVGHHESAYRSQNYSILCQITSTAFATPSRALSFKKPTYHRHRRSHIKLEVSKEQSKQSRSRSRSTTPTAATITTASVRHRLFDLTLNLQRCVWQHQFTSFRRSFKFSSSSNNNGHNRCFPFNLCPNPPFK